jgi:manganese/zinc/iron transport system permease protein
MIPGGWEGFWMRLVEGPWSSDPAGYLQIALMGFACGAACGLTGLVLILRRTAMLGDAISHSVLPGLVAAYLITGSSGTWVMFAGALAAGTATTGFVHLLRSLSPIRQDAAIGITFSSLFALGVVLVALFTENLHLDTDAVLYGELLFVPLDLPLGLGGWELGPASLVRMLMLAAVTAVLIHLTRRLWIIASFDPGLARTLGLRPNLVHYAILGWTALVVVGAFEAVGAIAVVAMLVTPGATALLISQRLGPVLLMVPLHAAIATVLGLHLAWAADASAAASIVLAGLGLFLIAWARSRYQTLRRQATLPEP